MFVTVTKQRGKAGIAADIHNSCYHIGTVAVKEASEVIDNKTFEMFRARVTIGARGSPMRRGEWRDALHPTQANQKKEASERQPYTCKTRKKGPPRFVSGAQPPKSGRSGCP